MKYVYTIKILHDVSSQSCLYEDTLYSDTSSITTLEPIFSPVGMRLLNFAYTMMIQVLGAAVAE